MLITLQYPIHQNVYNDIGSAKPFNCPAGLSGLAGAACCDGALQYEASKTIDMAKQEPDFNKHNTRNLAKVTKMHKNLNSTKVY